MRRRRLPLLIGVSLAFMACDGSSVPAGPTSLADRPAAGGKVDDADATQDRAPLPNWAAEWELEVQRAAPPPDTRDDEPAPPAGFRLPAEYEPTRAVVITYAAYSTLLKRIAVEVAAAGAEVWAVGGPSSIPGVPAASYTRLSYAFDSVWVRDYGPVGIDEATGALGIVDNVYRHYASRVDDDAIPCQVASHAGGACYASPLVLDGGNLMTDGRGNLFMTRRTYVWNSSRTEAEVDELLRRHLGVTTIHAFDYAQNGYGPADGTGHIDMFAKLLAPCTVLVAEYAQAPFAGPLDAAASTFAELECAPGQQYQVLRIPGWQSGSTWYTYTNSLIVNDRVLVPSYADGVDETARAIYEQALPGATVVLIPADASITSGGAIHCVAKEIPVAAPAPTPPATDAGVDDVGADDASVDDAGADAA
jgi:agmatine deiminase